MLVHQSIFVLLLASSRLAWGCPAHLDRREAQEEQAAVSASAGVTINNFEYTATNGPLTWHKLPNSPLCKDGENQSPILLDGGIRQLSVGSLSYNAPTRPGELEHKGTAIEVIDVTGTLSYERRPYRLRNVHFHTPSEHRINKEHFPVEMHMVHTDDTNTRTVVLGFVFQLSAFGNTNDLARVALANVGRISPGQKIRTGPLDFGEINNYVSGRRFYQYGGSLTVPPCSEGVQWLVGTEPLLMSVSTYNALKAAVGYNSRIIQNTLGSTNAVRLGCE